MMTKMDSPLELRLREEWEQTRKTEKWTDWRWQNKNRITTAEELSQLVYLTEEQYREVKSVLDSGRDMSIPPHYAMLIDPENPLEDPIGRTIIPRGFMQVEELPSNVFSHEQDIPVMDGKPVTAVRDLYNYEILIRATWYCPTKCQFCYTGETVLEKDSNLRIRKKDLEQAIEYIRRVNSGDAEGIALHDEQRPGTKIRDVLLSGGDVMGLSNNSIEYLLKGVREAGFKEVIRIGTKTLATMPQRFDEETTEMLSSYAPLQIDASIMHPNEFTPEMDNATKNLQRYGIMVNSGTVLMNGVNNTEEVIEELLWGFHERGIRPEYFYRAMGRYGQWAKTKREEDFKLFEPFWNHKKVPGTVIPRLVDPTDLGKVVYSSSTYNIVSEGGVTTFNIDGKKTTLRD